MKFKYDGIDYVSMSRVSRTTGWLAIATLPVSEVNAPRNQLITVLAVVSILIIALLIFVILRTVRRMIRPLADISTDMHSFSEGSLSIDVDIHSDDEIGQLADSIRSSTHTLREIILDMAHVLKEISDGNLNVEVTGQYTGDFTAIRDALEQILLSLNNALGQINTVADQVSSGAEQVSTCLLYTSQPVCSRLVLEYFRQRLHLRVCIICQVQCHGLRQSRLFRRSIFEFSMMCDDTVFQLARQLFRKAWNRADCLTYHFHTDDNMSQQLPVIGIIIVRKCGQFFCFSYIMADRRCIEQVCIQDRIGLSLIHI